MSVPTKESTWEASTLGRSLNATLDAMISVTSSFSRVRPFLDPWEFDRIGLLIDQLNDELIDLRDSMLSRQAGSK
jgi:hypothetical protein